MFLNLGFNPILPILILNKGERWLGGLLQDLFADIAVGVLLIAVSFPVLYFIYDYFKRSKINLLSILGLLSVLLTGLFGVLKLPVEWFPVRKPDSVGAGDRCDCLELHAQLLLQGTDHESGNLRCAAYRTALREHRSEDAFAR